MDDLISRQAAIDAICEHGTDLERKGITVLAVANHKQVTVDLLESLPSVQPKQWIPCSERLPIEDVKSYAPYDEHLSAFVMVTLKGQTWPYKKLTVKLARYSYSRNEWRIANNNLGEVIAWMPLPEPYKGEQE